jgi:hypothetical protein
MIVGLPCDELPARQSVAYRLIRLVTAALLAVGSPVGAELSVAPGYRVEVVARDLPYAIDAIEPFRGTLFVSVGAPMPGGRLLRFALPADAPTPISAQSAMTYWSSARLSPLVAYLLTGRVHAGVPEQGRVIKLPELEAPWRSESAENLAAAEWTPESLIVGLMAIHDLTFGSDGRLLVADGARVLETPVYFTPPIDGGYLRTVHQCAGSCQGVAVAGNGDLLVLEADGPAGRVVRQGRGGAVHVVAAGLPRLGTSLRLGPGGDLYFTSAAGLLQLTPHGGLIRVLSGFASPTRVNLDPDGNPLVADPDGGVVLRIRLSAE